MTPRFWVPVRVTIVGYALIKAPTLEDAIAMAENGEFDFNEIYIQGKEEECNVQPSDT